MDLLGGRGTALFLKLPKLKSCCLLSPNSTSGVISYRKTIEIILCWKYGRNVLNDNLGLNTENARFALLTWVVVRSSVDLASRLFSLEVRKCVYKYTHPSQWTNIHIYIFSPHAKTRLSCSRWKHQITPGWRSRSQWTTFLRSVFPKTFLILYCVKYTSFTLINLTWYLFEYPQLIPIAKTFLPELSKLNSCLENREIIFHRIFIFLCMCCVYSG